MTLSSLFERCLHISYTRVGRSADYARERIGSTLYLYFEASDGAADWKSNLNFPAKPYRRMDGPVWFAHRGFLQVWKTIEPYVADDIADPTVKAIVLVGYSHGAAVAALCHEYVWYHRPDLRKAMRGYGFGCPRVFWGISSSACRRRWAQFCVIRNIDDIVTHVPPAILGFSHVGKMLEIGTRGTYSRVDAHRPENILAELKRYENESGLSTAPVLILQTASHRHP